jgi:hypothetical protein
MPGGKRDSSKTRVVPVFDRLRCRSDDWVRELLGVAKHGSGACVPTAANLSLTAGYWGTAERALEPPVALLSWLIRNLQKPVRSTQINDERARLLAGDVSTVATALELLRSAGTGAAWHVFEGPSYPDAYIETPDALVVVEGKRPEREPTVHTTWMPCRHQIWRHMDAAWEIRGRRAVFGLLLVEGADPDPFEVPSVWQEAAVSALCARGLRGSFPHRSDEERHAIAQGFQGVATWQRVCRHFAVDFGALPTTTADLGA